MGSFPSKKDHLFRAALKLMRLERSRTVWLTDRRTADVLRVDIERLRELQDEINQTTKMRCSNPFGRSKTHYAFDYLCIEPEGVPRDSGASR